MRIFKISYFSLPQSALSEIIQYVSTTYVEFHNQNRKRVSKQVPKYFWLNLEGTEYEFLRSDKFNPCVYISFCYNEKGVSYMNGYNNIVINLAESLDHIISNSIEHEVLHCIQHMIQEFGSNEGGLPPKQYVDQSLTYDGYIKRWKFVNGGYSIYKDNKQLIIEADNPKQAMSRIRGMEGLVNSAGFPIKDISNFKPVAYYGNAKRVPHSRRPTEYQTDLNSAIRDIQLKFEKQNELNKQEYFNALINYNRFTNTINPFPSMAYRILFEDFPEDLRQWAISKAYAAFMSEDTNFVETTQGYKDQLTPDGPVSVVDPVVFVSNGKDFHESVFNNSGTIKVDSLDRMGWSNLEDGNGDFALNMIDQLPYIKERESIRDYTTYIYIPMNWKKLKKIFQKITNIKAKHQEIYPNDTVMINNYDYFKKSIAEEVSKHLSYNHSQSFEVSDFLSVIEQ